jgi:formate dehydrogenase subunit gamma
MARLIQRYRDGDRMNHWAVAILFVLAALSGLALFHPSLFFFSHLFGGGSWTRILHPFMGLFMVLLFIGLFFRFRRENRITAEDRAWRARMGRMIRGDKAGMPAAGKYNYAQKLVFWVFALCLLVLLVTGFMFWRPWFAPAFPIIAIRIAALLHAIAAFGLVMAVIVHVYAAIWVKGTMRAMTRGTVTEAWARHNHPLWHGEVTRSSR